MEWSQALLSVAVIAMSVGPAVAAPRRVDVDRKRSFFAARTATAGLLGFLGHEHGIVATEWDAEVCLDPASPSGARAAVRVPVEGLRIDTAEAMTKAGLDRHVAAEQQRKLQSKMLGPSVLDAANHPWMRFELASVELLIEGTGRITGTLEIHGVRREVTVSLRGVLAERRLEVRGELEIRQTDFGIQPESIAGVVKVADPMKIVFAVAGRMTDRSCE